ncbi:hypothetical protein N6G96_05950 [Pediococcus inopinatus]|uniref:Integral membrane protein n=1 Tax=Pediococcus inopinatus TaxID=114090 RepID=A0ABZ0Q1R5_9LACO|nr:hypothetical protein [Pediococcus inopinatus]WPC20851.1 hypothetical protein N6G96_05950 [Pediococcus inopinatus]
MYKYIKRNRFLFWRGVESLSLGSFFLSNAFVFARPDFINSIASHLDDPPFATLLILVGSFTVFVAMFNERQFFSICLALNEGIWVIYFIAFAIQDFEARGHMFTSIGTVLSFMVAIQIMAEAFWGGDR